MSASTRYALFVALGGFIFGFDAAIIGGVTPFITKLWALEPWQVGSVVAAPTFAAMFSALIVTTLADMFGRKPILIIIAVIYAFSAAYSAFAPDLSSLVIARFIGGFGFGCLVLAPIYISEVAPAGKRGKLVSINQFNIVVGLSAAYFASYFIVQAVNDPGPFAESIKLDEHQWRWMLGLELIPGLFFIGMLFLIPESPRWLLLNNQKEKALQIFTKLLGSEKDAHETAEQHLNDSPDELPPLLTRIKLIFGKRARFALMIGIVVAIAQQITGINAIFFYAQTIFEQSGVGQNAAFAQAVIIGVTNVVFTVIAMMLIDKLGRKPLLLTGLASIFIAMSICAYQFHNASYTLTQDTVNKVAEAHSDALAPLIDVSYESDLEFNAAVKEAVGEESAKEVGQGLLNASISLNSKVFLFGIILFVASFAFSLGPVMWVLLPEIFPNQLRGIGMAVTGIINSTVSFLVQFLFLIELSTIGAASTFMLFGVFALVALAILVVYLPETKGKSLEELEETFMRP